MRPVGLVVTGAVWERVLPLDFCGCCGWAMDGGWGLGPREQGSPAEPSNTHLSLHMQVRPMGYLGLVVAGAAMCGG